MEGDKKNKFLFKVGRPFGESLGIKMGISNSNPANAKTSLRSKVL